MIVSNSTQAAAANQAGVAAAAGAAQGNSGTGMPFLAILNRQVQFGNSSPYAAYGYPMMYPMAMVPRQGFAVQGMGLPGLTGLGASMYGMAGYSPLAAGMSSTALLMGQYTGQSNDGGLGELLQNVDAQKVLSADPTAALASTATDSTTAATGTTTDTTQTADNTTQDPNAIISDPKALGEKIADKIAQMAQNGYANVAFSVNTPQYGQVDAQVSVVNGQASIRINSPNSELRAALELSTDSLRQSLNNQGISLARFDVSEPAQVASGGQLTTMSQLNSLIASLESLYGNNAATNSQDSSATQTLSTVA